MKIVFDTNVIVGGLVARGPCHEVVEVHLPLYEAVLSRVLWEELIGALRENLGLDQEELPLIDLYRRHAVWVEPSPLADPVCRDRSDDWVLATARAGEDLFLNGLILQEVLQAFRSEKVTSQVAEALGSFPLLPLGRATCLAAARLYRRCRSEGLEASTNDCQIAAVAIAHNCQLLTADRDFEQIEQISALKLV